MIFISCKRNEDLSKIDQSSNIAPTGFNYATSKTIKINIRLLSNLGEPLIGVPVSFHSTKDTSEVLYALTNKQGYIDTKLIVPAYAEQLIVKPHYTGLVKELKGFFKDNALDLIIGGSNSYSGNVVSFTNNLSSANSLKLSTNSQTYITNANTNYSFIGGYDGDGRPQYLTPTPGNVSADLLGFLNSSLPEEKSVENHHLVYLSPNAKRSIDVIEDGDVFITYVSEGATNENTIAYYSYPTNQKLANANEITNIKYIFPNSSGKGSGGGLISGDRVNLGNFKAGTSIGIVLLVNGWDKNTKTVKNNGVKFYSDETFNPEHNQNLKKHTVVLSYDKEDLLIIGFEDINREDFKSDHDFNDIVLYASSFPKTALSHKNVVKLAAPVDSDGDGISDDNDIHPGDSKKAYDTYFPSKTGWGTIAFEDNWPRKGDYDMNDLVVNYRYSFAVNANNEITEMKADYKINESLAYYQNGFGVELPINPSVIDDVRGYINSGKYIKYNVNGTEAGQDKAVFIPFDNQKLIYNSSVNYAEPVRIIIEFLRPQPLSSLNPILYNPFLISDGRREYEIHLPGFKPTNKVGKALFGTYEDKSDPAKGLYYIGENNWPWALQFLETFNFPDEKQAIDEKYPRFKDWAASGGTNYLDWYK
jgi:LruC domain-containing protein